MTTRSWSGKYEDDAFHRGRVLRAALPGLYPLDLAVPLGMRVAEVWVDAGLVEGIGDVTIAGGHELELNGHARVSQNRVTLAVYVPPGDLRSLFDGDGERLEPVGVRHHNLCFARPHRQAVAHDQDDPVHRD